MWDIRIWWEELLAQVEPVADDPVAFIRDTQDINLNFLNLPFTVTKFYTLYLAERAASDAEAYAASPVEIDTMQSDTVEHNNVPEEIESITRGPASEHPPTNPIVVLKTARWWYLHGKGGTDPAFRWAIEWARHLATNTPGDVEHFDECLE